MSRNRTIAVTAAIMLSLFLASMEVTVVATAMPTIVAELGGLAVYSWVFSAYMLASTTTVPIFGKLADLYGRRPVFIAAMALFLAGSLVAGVAQSMTQLIAARALQGLGAGGVLPLTFTIVGELFSFEQRARMQGVFSGVWGVSSIIGPLLGGFIVDNISWRWVFFVNLPFGLLAAAIVWLAWRDVARAPHERVPVDYAGAALLTAGVVALLLGLFELGAAAGGAAAFGLLALAALLLAALAVVELRAPDPVLPVALFRDRVFTVACLHGVLSGAAVFGSASFIPLYAQAVLGKSATEAGATLTPQLLAWVSASVVGSRLLLRFSYRRLALGGMLVAAAGALLLMVMGTRTTHILLMAGLALMGAGMGLSIPAFLIIVQSSVRRQALGTATATLQFSRSIGGTLGVSIMGAALAGSLAAGLAAAGLDPASVPINALLDRTPGAPAVDPALRAILAGALNWVFVITALTAVLALVATALAPARDPRRPPVTEASRAGRNRR